MRHFSNTNIHFLECDWWLVVGYLSCHPFKSTDPIRMLAEDNEGHGVAKKIGGRLGLWMVAHSYLWTICCIPVFYFQLKNYRISRAAKADFEFIVLLSQPPEYLDTVPSAHQRCFEFCCSSLVKSEWTRLTSDKLRSPGDQRHQC